MNEFEMKGCPMDSKKCIICWYGSCIGCFIDNLKLWINKENVSVLTQRLVINLLKCLGRVRMDYGNIK